MLLDGGVVPRGPHVVGDDQPLQEERVAVWVLVVLRQDKDGFQKSGLERQRRFRRSVLSPDGIRKDGRRRSDTA